MVKKSKSVQFTPLLQFLLNFLSYNLDIKSKYIINLINFQSRNMDLQIKQVRYPF